MLSDTQKLAIDLIRRSQKILILPSSPPDGDSIGSAVSLYMSLKKLGKEITVICSEPIPEVLQFLPNTKVIGNKLISSNDFIVTIDKSKIDNIKNEIENDKVNIIITPKGGQISSEDFHFNKAKTNYDLIITVDCGELIQLRDLYEKNVEMFHQIPIVNIDHHVSNTHFGKINHVDIMASSTTELLVPLLEQFGKEENKTLIDEDVATLLLTGIITDTGSFQNANTTPRAFARAAQLISYGARQQEIIQHIYKTKQLSQLKLWGRVLSKIQTDEKYKIVWSAVSQQDFKDTESTEDQTGDIIDELMTNAPEAEIVLLIKEKEDKTISVSVRTTSSLIDASKIAENFSGGGHARAAGFRMSGIDLREAEYQVIKYIRELQSGKIVEQVVEEKHETPIINVKELMDRASSAQKATELMPKPEDAEKYNELAEKYSTPLEVEIPTVETKDLKEKKIKVPSKKLKIKIPLMQNDTKPKSETPESNAAYKFED